MTEKSNIRRNQTLLCMLCPLSISLLFHKILGDGMAGRRIFVFLMDVIYV